LYLSHLSLSNVRNISDSSLELGPVFNLITGRNGAGKTALLEGIYVLARGRSFRAGGWPKLIKRDEQELTIRAEGVRDAVGIRLGLARNRNGSQQLRVNGKNSGKLSDIAAHLPVTMLAPNVGDLVTGSPLARRQFLDWGLFHVEQSFLATARAYKRALSQRNAWLRSLPGKHRTDSPDTWLTPMLVYGIKINDWRQRYVALLDKAIGPVLEDLSKQMDVSLQYQGAGYDTDEISARVQIQSEFESEVRYRQTTKGPHRADLSVSFQGVAASTTASRGQAKLIACGLLLAQVEVLQQARGITPIILIDDFASELDPDHIQRLLSKLVGMGCQIIATAADRRFEEIGKKLGSDPTLFHVEQGQFEKKHA
tara:strand:- start:10614 stop:11717 length:1104 start_codon:yes stop_codon:yes gene_type:complete